MKKSLLCLTAAVILAFSMSGCGDVSDSSSAESAKDALANTESVETPPELPDIEPVPVPEGGWTEETIQDVIYINGKNVHLPCKFEEFGDGFEISIDEYTKFNDDNHAFVTYKYNDIMIGGMGIDNCANQDELQSGDVVYIWCSTDYLEDGSDNRAPVSINGVSLGSTKEDIENNLDFEMAEVKKGSDYSGNAQIGNFSISLIVENNTLDIMTIAYHVN